MTYATELDALSRTPQELLTLAVRYCANRYSETVEQGIRYTEYPGHGGFWTKTADVVQPGTIVAPDGGVATNVFTADVNEYVRQVADFSAGPLAGDVDEGSWFLKLPSGAGTGTITLRIRDTASTEVVTLTCNLTESWQRFHKYNRLTGPPADIMLELIRLGGDVEVVHLWGANLHRIPSGPDRCTLLPYIKRTIAGVTTVAYNVSRCQAADAGDGSRCFYSRPTCQDPAGFNSGNSYEATPALQGLRLFRFCSQGAPLALPGEDVMPLIVGFDEAEQEIDPERAVTMNERIEFIFDDDAGPGTWDRAKEQSAMLINTARGVGTFWRRWLAIFKNYANPECYATFSVGFVFSGVTITDYEQRKKMLMQNVRIGADGRVTLVCTDRLKLLRKKIPAKISQGNTLQANINAAATTLEVYDAAEFTPPGEGYTISLRIGDEKLNLVSRDTLLGQLEVTRGRWDTDAASHSKGDAIEEIIEFGTEATPPSDPATGLNAMDCAIMLLKLGGIGLSDIDITTLEDERDTWIPDVLFRRTLDKQTKVEELLTEIREVLLLFMWIGDDAKVTGKLFAPARPTETLVELTEETNFIAGSLDVDDNDESRITRTLIAWEQRPNTGGDSAEDFYRIQVHIGADEEGAAYYGEDRLKVVLSKWIIPGDTATPFNFAKRVMDRFQHGARLLGWRLELRDDVVTLGQFVKVRTAKLQNPDGSTAPFRIMQVTRKRRDRTNGQLEYRALDTGIMKRYFFWAPDGLPDYDNATEDQQRYGFWSDDEGLIGTPKVPAYHWW